jgi:hypothetical protein
LRNGFLQLGQKLQKLVKKTEGILGVNDRFKNDNRDFLEFNVLNGFSTQFPNITPKASTLCSAKVLCQEDSKFAHPVLQGVKIFSSLQML